MHPCAPRAVRLGIGFAGRAQSDPIDARPRVLGALARGPVFVTPADCQNLSKWITLRVAARTVRPGEVGGVDELATHRRLPRRVFPDWCFPALSLFPAQRPAQLAKWR